MKYKAAYLNAIEKVESLAKVNKTLKIPIFFNPMESHIEEWTDEFNPFNSAKLWAQYYRWKEIQEGNVLPAPALVTIDPTNICNLKCIWCNADYIQNKNPKSLSPQALDKIADFLPYWSDNSKWENVEAVCIAGGGEPLMNKYTGNLIKRLKQNNVEPGIVTNGTFIDKNLEALTDCTWVGVSVDAGTPEVYKKLKGKNLFTKVIDNIQKLTSIQEGTELGEPGKGPGVSYKFLMHPENISDIYSAAKLAKEIGCKNFHLRPYGVPWDKIKLEKDKESFRSFSYGDIEEFRRQFNEASKLEDENFNVFGITHKFDGDLKRTHRFDKCRAVFMTSVFEPPTDKNALFDLGLCCDRRGDPQLTIENIKDVEEIKKFWGSKDHWDRAKKIKVGTCPRCTYQPHNLFYEKAIGINNMTIPFI